MVVTASRLTGISSTKKGGTHFRPFVLRPQQLEPNGTTGKKKKKKEKTKKKKRFWTPPTAEWAQRFMTNLLIITILSLSVIDTCPYFWPFDAMGPAKGIVWPLLCALGNWQDAHSMFAPNVDRQNEFYMADIHLENSTIIRWTSPIWGEMSWWERAMRMRWMDYYERVEYSDFTWKPLCRYLASQTERRLGQHVASIGLVFRSAKVPKPPPTLRWHDPVKQPLKYGYRDLYQWKAETNRTKRLWIGRHEDLSDLHPDCPIWAKQGECAKNPEFMKNDCSASCYGWEAWNRQAANEHKKQKKKKKKKKENDSFNSVPPPSNDGTQEGSSTQ